MLWHPAQLPCHKMFQACSAATGTRKQREGNTSGAEHADTVMLSDWQHVVQLEWLL